ncbi:unnamed protein product, partial [Laminaria digitata]
MILYVTLLFEANTSTTMHYQYSSLTALHYSTLHDTTLRYTALHLTILHRTRTLRYTTNVTQNFSTRRDTMHLVIQPCAILHYITLLRTTQHYTVLRIPIPQCSS